MKKRKVINRKQLPTKLPLTSTLLAILMMDYYSAPQWVWGVVITLLSVLWVYCLYAIVTDEDVEIDLNK